jgi:hypothetical protein
MTRVSKLDITLGGLHSTIAGIVKDWRPGALKNEGAYSTALAAVLRGALPEDIRIEREYRHEGTTSDVGVLSKGFLSDNSVLIELKLNLRRKTAYDRLVGQIEGLRPAKNKVLIVLVGETDPGLLGRLNEHLGRYNEILNSGAIRIVTVPS